MPAPPPGSGWPACALHATFLWLTVVLAALCLRPDLGGVTSLVRALGLSAATYPCLLHFFHSNGLRLEPPTRLWRETVERLFARRLVRIKGRPVLLVDGLKRSKEGRWMPAVKSLHQESGSNSKASFIMGHSRPRPAGRGAPSGHAGENHGGRLLPGPAAPRQTAGLVWLSRAL